MKTIFPAALVISFLLCQSSEVKSQQQQRAYRLNSVDLDQRVIWGAECRLREGLGLAFGGQDQDAEDGRPHTRLLIEGQWTAIDQELRQNNSLQSMHEHVWSLRQAAKDLRAKARHIYFQGSPRANQAEKLQREVAPGLSQLAQEIAAFETDVPSDQVDEYDRDQVRFASEHLQRAAQVVPTMVDGVTVEMLKRLHQVQIDLELAAEALAAEPPARAMNCGTARLSSEQSGPASNTLVYDTKTDLFVLFGGDHLDYLTNDTWVFSPKDRRWYQRHPAAAPPPRANHRLAADGNGIITLTGGYTYTSNTDYLGGQYRDLEDGTWTYDVAANRWMGGELVPADSRVYRSGPFHPDYYLEGPRPDAANFEAWLKELPVNEWVPTDPPQRPRLNRDWGTARIDTDRDLMLRWSGGHSAHGGTDVPHYHFATNRWELPFPVEFPLGQLYSNTSYPNGLNFNRRPWMTGHTYQNYDYDPPSKTMIKSGRPRHYYVYDPDRGDWIGRGEKPAAMQYNSCFYTLTLTATPGGVVCWDKNGKVHRYDHTRGSWMELELTGDELPGAYVDNSTICYDTKRDRLLIVNTLGYGKEFDGQVWSVDLKSLAVQSLSPAGQQQAHRFANVDKCCFVAEHDLMLLGTYLKEAGDHTPTPAYDCANNRWIVLDLKYTTGQRSGNTTRAFPHARSDGMMFDSTRKLLWGTDTNSQVYVLRLEPAEAGVRPL